MRIHTVICYHIMWLILLLFYPVYSISYPKERCSMIDCSRQLHPFQNRSCVIHNSSVCKYWMSNFTQSSEIELKDEDEAEFSISVTPYIAEIYVNPITFALSAINITLRIQEMGVNAIAVKLSKENLEPICRIFDFQNLERNFTLPVNFFYDCFYDLQEYSSAQMDVIALPMNNLLSYYVYIPPSQPLNPISSCYWKPVIMVFCGRLSNGIVTVKFSQAPQHLNISLYLVELIGNSSKQLSLGVPAQEADMLSAKFYNVGSGYYSAVVRPSGKSCNGTQVGVFQVVNSNGFDTLTGICIGIILLFTCCFFVFYKMYAKSMKLELSKRQALLVFSHDCQEHKDFVTSLIDYFSQICHLEVSTIYNRQGPLSIEQSAKKWKEDRYDESDIIIFLISEGLLITLNEKDKNLQQVKVFHPWKTQLRDTSNYIFKCLSHSKDDFNSKQICKVRFSYSSQLRIPEILDRKTGKCFLLPEQMNKFLHFVHERYSAIPCVHPSLCQNLNSSQVGKTLLQRIEAVQAKVNSNSHVEYELDRIPNNDAQGTDSHLSYMVNEEQLLEENSDIFNNISLYGSSNISMSSKDGSVNEGSSLLNDHNSIINSDDSISNPNKHVSVSEKSISDSDEFLSESDEDVREFLQDCWKAPRDQEHG